MQPLQPRQVKATQGWAWIVQGFALFRKHPLIWIVLFLIGALLLILLAFIPLLGPLLVSLLFPVFFAGMMLGCRAIEAGEDLEIAHLFAGFKHNPVRLVSVGGVNLVGQFLIFGVMVAMGPDKLEPIGANPQTPEATLRVLNQLAPALLSGAALSVPLMMALWFTPALLGLHDIGPVAAIRLSFQACAQNALAFLLYGAIVMFLFLVPIPFTLGVASLIVVPILIASVYTGYKDIFLPAESAAGQAA
jgi:uncharacterized membrane protein